MSRTADEEYSYGVEAIRRDIQAARNRGGELRLKADLRLWATMGVAA